MCRRKKAGRKEWVSLSFEQSGRDSAILILAFINKYIDYLDCLSNTACI
jgi:hypothetical protein